MPMLRSWLLGLVAAGLVAALALLVRFSRRRALVVDRLARALANLAEGRPLGPVLGEGEGPFAGLAGILADAGPRIETRLVTLERETRQLAAVLAAMREGVIAVDARRRLVFANESAARIFGFGPGAVGRLVTEVIRSPRVFEALDATLVGPGPLRVEISIPRPGGPRLGGAQILDVQGTPLPGSPAPGALLVFHDLTELRRLERMRQDFVANASHELKTPLASIKSYTEALLDGALHDEEVNAAFLRRIDEQADRLDRLILDLLNLARIESGRDVFRHSPIALGVAVERIVEIHRDRAEAKALDLAVSIEAASPPLSIVADEEALRLVLDNLVDNAIKYTPAGGRVVVSVKAEGERAVIEVADSGIGIPRDEQSRVFERFYRVDRARSREMGGTGLGLAIVKHMVQSLGGSVQLSSRLGLGSTFTVQIPRGGDRSLPAEDREPATGP